MVENTYRVGKTQWSKWNDAGRESYNYSRSEGIPEKQAIRDADTVTKAFEDGRRAKKRGVFGALQNVAEAAGDVARMAGGVAETVAAVVPVVAVAKTVVKAVRPKKGK